MTVGVAIRREAELSHLGHSGREGWVWGVDAGHQVYYEGGTQAEVGFDKFWARGGTAPDDAFAGKIEHKRKTKTKGPIRR